MGGGSALRLKIRSSQNGALDTYFLMSRVPYYLFLIHSVHHYFKAPLPCTMNLNFIFFFFFVFSLVQARNKLALPLPIPPLPP